MKKLLLLLSALCMITNTVSCASNEEFEQRLDKRNQAYSDYNDRRTKRLDARQERTDMWFDRHMD
jgi:outer membrane lipoprotein-sorting protein